MPTTTKMGIVYPASTDLVKDGATNMGTISTTVDAKTGMVLLDTQTFSAVSAVNFTSKLNTNFDIYKLYYTLTTSSTNDVFVRLRSGSTDATTSDYTVQVIGVNSTSVSASRATNSYWFCNQIATATEFSGVYDLFNPFKAQVTNVIAQQYVSTGTTVYFNSANSMHNLTNSYDGLSLVLSGAGTMTGSAYLFGVNK